VGFDFVIGTSGTIMNLVQMTVEAERGNGDHSSEFEPFSQTMNLDQLRKLNRKLSRLNVRERGRAPGIEKDRADIIVGGGLLLENILSEIGAKAITTCDWSLREGIVLDYLRRHAAELGMTELLGGRAGGEQALGEEREVIDLIDSHSLDVRTRSVLSVARRYNYDAPHAHHVARMATSIFDATRALHRMGDEERRILQYAALLHDIGHHIAHDSHNLHSLYLIKHSEMPGFAGNETALLAVVVRYHRGSMPLKDIDRRARRQHEDLLSLDRADRKRALGLAAILQIADGLDRTYRQTVSEARCEVDGKRVTISIRGEGDLELEVWSADRKARWLREVFGVECEIRRRES
jgi:exopolyphosphatase/guanosine-5'-triphosphate,3'-diphosphate pyrophosphatase